MADTLSSNSTSTPTLPTQQNGSNQPTAGSNSPVSVEETGAQYEQTELPPEDLDARWLRWKCGVCNYTYEGAKPLKKCPRCGNEDQDKFLDAD